MTANGVTYVVTRLNPCEMGLQATPGYQAPQESQHVVYGTVSAVSLVESRQARSVIHKGDQIRWYPGRKQAKG